MLEHLRDLRRARGISQSRLAQRLGVSQQAVAKWEAGRAFPSPELLVRLAEIFQVSTDYLLASGRPGPLGVRAEPRAVQLPIIGLVRAGYDSAAYEEEQGWESAFVRDPQQYFYLQVTGDSMEPYIHAGDLALVRRQQTLENGDLGVIIYGDGAGTLKRFRRERGRILLEPFNPAYETIALEQDDFGLLLIAGRVVETKTRW